MDAANWTAVVGDSTVDKTTGQPQSLNLSSLASEDSDNGKSRECPELEALKRIYEKICTIRDNHAQIVAENAAKRSEVCVTAYKIFFNIYQLFSLLIIRHIFMYYEI